VTAASADFFIRELIMNANPASDAMMTMTIRSSTNVNPLPYLLNLVIWVLEATSQPLPNLTERHPDQSRKPSTPSELLKNTHNCD
jgi:hypothetical protein